MVVVGNGFCVVKMAQVLGCEVASFFIKYLGLPLGSKEEEKIFGTSNCEDGEEIV